MELNIGDEVTLITDYDVYKVGDKMFVSFIDVEDMTGYYRLVPIVHKGGPDEYRAGRGIWISYNWKNFVKITSQKLKEVKEWLK